MSQPMRSRVRARRRGLGAVTLVLGLLAVIAALGWYQQSYTRQTLSQVHRTQLAFLARLQARSAIAELRARAAADLNRRESALARTLRKAMDGPWTELDLSHHLAPPELQLEPRWGKAGAKAGGGASGRILEASVRARAGRPHLDPVATEESIGLLTFRVRAAMRDAMGEVVREVEESYELRTVLATLPRPFDQLDLFVGNVGAVVDVGRVAALRETFIARQEALKAELAAAAQATTDPDLAARLRAIADGMLPRAELERRVPLLDPASCLVGFHHLERGRLEEIALLPVLEGHAREVAELEDELAAARPDPVRVAEVGYRLASALSNAHDASWGFQHSMTLIPFASERYRRDIAPYLGRLDPAYLMDRAHLAFREDDVAFRHWLRGRATLEGVVDLTSWDGPVTLEGTLQGRVVLLVGPGGADLRNLNRRTPTHAGRITVVSLGGDVRVRGRCRASVVMLHRPGNRLSAGKLEVDGGAVLVGSLLLPDPSPTRLAIAGELEPDSEVRASFPPSATLDWRGAGEYVLAMSPDPLFTDGRSP